MRFFQQATKEKFCREVSSENGIWTFDSRLKTAREKCVDRFQSFRGISSVLRFYGPRQRVRAKRKRLKSLFKIIRINLGE